MDVTPSSATTTAVFNAGEIRASVRTGAQVLFLSEATLDDGGAAAVYRIIGDEAFFRGHFKDNPVMPASVMLEALGLLGLLAAAAATSGGAGDAGGERSARLAEASGRLRVTAVDGVRCHRVCRPGEVLTLTLKKTSAEAGRTVFAGSVRVGTEKAVSLEAMTVAGVVSGG